MPQDIVALTAGLYDFILESEAPLSARKGTFDAARERVAAAADGLARRIAEERDRLTTAVRGRLDEVGGRLDEALETLQKLRAELALRQPAQDQLERLWKGLGGTYEALRAQVRRLRLQVPQGVVLGPVKPRNLARNVFHLIMALTGVLTYEFLLDRTGVIIAASTLLALFLTLEVVRRASSRWNERFVNGMFKAIARPQEAHRVPAATWYIAALVIGCVALPQRAIQLGTLALGVGDPVAQILGKRFGKKKIVGQKSWIGAMGFVAAATVASLVFLGATGTGGAIAAQLVIAVTVGVAGALAELFSGPLDDNFTIPLIAGLAVTAFFI
jgi:dolichol kinase